MSRTAWLAAGSVAAAAAGAEIARTRTLDPAAVLGAVVGAVAVLAAAARLLSERSPRSGSAKALMALAAASIGVGLVVARIAVGPAPPPLVQLPESDGPWIGRVASISTPRDGRQRATVELAFAPPIRIALDAPRYPPVQPLDRIEVSGSLRPLPDDDYGAYLRRSGVEATLRARTLRVVPAPVDPFAAIETIRRAGGDALSLALPEPEAGLAAGILIGLRDRVDRALATTFTTAGVSHVVAISGWNIAIVALLIDRLLANVPRRRRRLITLGAIATYTLLTGASPSVLRAAAMAVAVALARETGRAGAASHALALAVTTMIVLEPGIVGDAGFQLSALATAGLIVWATPLTEWLRARSKERLPAWLCISLGVSLAAQAATLPVVLLSFGRLAVLAPLLNLAVVPLVPGAMAGSALALVVGGAGLAGLPVALVAVAAIPGWIVLAALVAIVRIGASLPLASVTLEPPLNVLAALMLPAAVLIRRQLRWLRSAVNVSRSPPSPTRVDKRERPAWRASLSRPLPRIALGALALAVATAGLVVFNGRDGRVRVTVLDVGQGDAIMIEGDRGSRLLIDGGPDPERLVGALDTRLPAWDRRLDILILSHPHEDHVAGLPALLERYRVRRVFDVGMRGPGPGFSAWTLALTMHGIRRERLTSGDAIGLDALHFEVLWPDADRVPAEPPDTGTAVNNVSVVLLGTFGAERILLMGDVEEEIDPILLARGLPRVTLLKVAHHGSRTSSTAAFLAATQPQIAVVSAGAKNPYGHPTAAALGRLRDTGATTYRTDQNGTVEVALDGRRAAVTSDRPLDPARSALAGFALAALRVSCLIPARPSPVRSRTGVATYHRSDVRARPSRGGTPAPLPQPTGLPPASRTAARGDRGMARRSDRPP